MPAFQVYFLPYAVGGPPSTGGWRPPGWPAQPTVGGAGPVPTPAGNSLPPVWPPPWRPFTLPDPPYVPAGSLFRPSPGGGGVWNPPAGILMPQAGDMLYPPGLGTPRGTQIVEPPLPPLPSPPAARPPLQLPYNPGALPYVRPTVPGAPVPGTPLIEYLPGTGIFTKPGMEAEVAQAMTYFDPKPLAGQATGAGSYGQRGGPFKPPPRGGGRPGVGPRGVPLVMPYSVTYDPNADQSQRPTFQDVDTGSFFTWDRNEPTAAGVFQQEMMTAPFKPAFYQFAWGAFAGTGPFAKPSPVAGNQTPFSDETLAAAEAMVAQIAAHNLAVDQANMAAFLQGVAQLYQGWYGQGGGAGVGAGGGRFGGGLTHVANPPAGVP